MRNHKIKLGENPNTNIGIIDEENLQKKIDRTIANYRYQKEQQKRMKTKEFWEDFLNRKFGSAGWYDNEDLFYRCYYSEFQEWFKGKSEFLNSYLQPFKRFLKRNKMKVIIVKRKVYNEDDLDRLKKLGMSTHFIELNKDTVDCKFKLEV